jgi:hypothetical protein
MGMNVGNYRTELVNRQFPEEFPLLPDGIDTGVSYFEVTGFLPERDFQKDFSCEAGPDQPDRFQKDEDPQRYQEK